MRLLKEHQRQDPKALQTAVLGLLYRGSAINRLRQKAAQLAITHCTPPSLAL
jgi:hypothetical protein